MILKCGLNLNKKKPPKKPPSGQNIFNQLRPGEESEHTIASQIATQSARQKQKAEQEKIKLLAEDPNVYAFDEVYDSMTEKKRGQIAARLNADTERKPKYFDKLVKRVEERKVEQGVIYQRGIVKERLAEDQMFSQTEAFITSSYKAQMIKDKAWQTQQDIIDRRNKGPTAAGMAGGFLSHLLNEPSSDANVPSADSSSDVKPEYLADTSRPKENTTRTSEERKTKENPKEERLEHSSEKNASLVAENSENATSVGVKRERPIEDKQAQSEILESGCESAATSSDQAQVPNVKTEVVKPSKEELAKAAKERYLQRKAQKRSETTI